MLAMSVDESSATWVGIMGACVPDAQALVSVLAGQLERPNHTPEECQLAPISSGFARALKMSDEIDLDVAGEFVRLLSSLISLRSYALLPHPAPALTEEEQMGVYAPPVDRAALRTPTAFLAQQQGRESFPSPPCQTLVARPVSPRAPTVLARVWADMQKRSGPAVRRLAAPQFVRLEVVVSALIRTLKTRSSLSFHRVLEGTNRNDAVIHFIAVLELLRHRRVAAEQDELFGDITIHRVDNERDANSRVG
jgi:segregation and condensation protein A